MELNLDKFFTFFWTSWVWRTKNQYNSITNSAVLYRNALGQSVGNALAYGVPLGGYTTKDKLGYPLKQTPTFKKHSNEMQKCTVNTIKNQI